MHFTTYTPLEQYISLYTSPRASLPFAVFTHSHLPLQVKVIINTCRSYTSSPIQQAHLINRHRQLVQHQPITKLASTITIPRLHHSQFRDPHQFFGRSQESERLQETHPKADIKKNARFTTTSSGERQNRLQKSAITPVFARILRRKLPFKFPRGKSPWL